MNKAELIEKGVEVFLSTHTDVDFGDILEYGHKDIEITTLLLNYNNRTNYFDNINTFFTTMFDGDYDISPEYMNFMIDNGFDIYSDDIIYHVVQPETIDILIQKYKDDNKFNTIKSITRALLKPIIRAGINLNKKFISLENDNIKASLLTIYIQWHGSKNVIDPFIIELVEVHNVDFKNALEIAIVYEFYNIAQYLADHGAVVHEHIIGYNIYGDEADEDYSGFYGTPIKKADEGYFNLNVEEKLIEFMMKNNCRFTYDSVDAIDRYCHDFRFFIAKALGLK